MKKYLIFIFSALILAVFLLIPRLADTARPSDFGLKEGDTISAAGSDDPDVYIINELGFKRLFLNPIIFSLYDHLGGFANVKNVSPQIRDAFPTSGLFRNCETNDQKVYGVVIDGEDTGVLHWVNVSGEEAAREDPNFFKKVFCINNNEFNWYPEGTPFDSVKDVPEYSRGTPTPTPPPGPPGPPGPTPTPSGSPTPTPPVDTIPPIISNIRAENIGQFSADLKWDTNEPADGQAEFPIPPCPGESNCLTPVVPGLVTNHVINVNGLTPDTTYTYRVKSRDAAGNLAVSANNTFRTGAGPTPTPPPPGPDTTPPTINSWDVQPRSGSGNVTISWSVTDAGGSHLRGAGVYRATFLEKSKCNDADQSGCSWLVVKIDFPPSDADSWASNTTDVLFPGFSWYRLRVEDYAGNPTYSVLIKVSGPPPAPPLSIEERLNTRTYPSIVQPYQIAENLNLTPQGGVTPLNESRLVNAARHDLFWQLSNYFGLVGNNQYPGLVTAWTPESIEVGMNVRNSLLYLNPKMILGIEVRWRDAPDDYIPDNSPYWKRDGNGNRIPGWAEGGYFLLDYANPAYRQIIVDQCKTLLDSKVVDFCMFDWWNDTPTEPPERVALIQAVRTAIGPDGLILVNVGHILPYLTAQYINGAWLEGWGGIKDNYWSNWNDAKDHLIWLNANLRQPRWTAFEGWTALPGGSRNDVNRMRLVTATGLIFSDGYEVFGDHNDIVPGLDHLHDWYPFWDKSLGRPIQTGYNQGLGAYSRNYDNGAAVANPPTNQTITFTFPELRTSKATGIRSQTHTLNAGDGDIYLK